MVDQVQSYFPDWRIYVFGVDVTEDVTTCTISHIGSDSQAPSVAEFELVNGGSRGTETISNEDKYIITVKDIMTLYSSVSEEFNKGLRLPTEKQVEAGLDPSDLVPDLSNASALPLPNLNDALAILGPDAEGLSNQEARIEAYRRQYPANQIREITRGRRAEAIKTRAAALQNSIFDQLIAQAKQIQNPVKQRVLSRKIGIRQKLEKTQTVVDPPTGAQTVGALAQITGQAARYPIQVGDCIFHTNDPVRIFWRDPKAPDRWYHMFCGFVSDFSESADVNNMQIVRLRCEDASRILRHARVTTDPGILDIDAVKTETDTQTRTFLNGGFADLTLPEFLFTMIYGTEATGTDGATGTNDLGRTRTYSNVRVGVEDSSTTEVPVSGGVGSFNFGQSFVGIFGEGADGVAEREARESPGKFRSIPIPDLGTYQALVDHRVYAADLDNLGLKDAESRTKIDLIKKNIPQFSDGRKSIEHVIDAIGRNPQLFPVDFGRLIFLVPASLGPGTNRDMLLRDIIGVNVQSTWRYRLTLIYDVMSRIDFSFYVSPRGDLLCEMPLYDFEPKDFGEQPIDLRQFIDTAEQNNLDSRVQQDGIFSDRLPAANLYEVDTDAMRGPYGPQMVIDRHSTISWDRIFIDDRIKTQMIGIHNLLGSFANTGGTSAQIGRYSPVNLYGLMPQFGVRSETIDPKGIIADENSARLYAAIKLNQINSNARNAMVEILPRVQLSFPNRPLEFTERAFVGTITEARHSLIWGAGGSMVTDIDVNYIRAWSGLFEDGDFLYEPIGGFGSQAFNYAVVQGLKNKSRRNSQETDNNTNTLKKTPQ